MVRIEKQKVSEKFILVNLSAFRTLEQDTYGSTLDSVEVPQGQYTYSLSLTTDTKDYPTNKIIFDRVLSTSMIIH